MDAIRTINLKKAYGDLTAVDGLNMTVRCGEIFSLLGLNGAGKSTTLKMLTCLTAPSEGDAYVFGRSVRREPSEVKRMIGVSPQETALAPNLSVLENLSMMCGIFGLSRESARARINVLSEQLSLRECLSRRAGKLSGGWQRRVSIAMALVASPSLLLLDEPTLGLDVLARRELWQIVRSLGGETTVLLTTHYMEEAQALSDRVGILDGGRLLAVGTPRELMEKTECASLEDAFVSLVGRERK